MVWLLISTKNFPPPNRGAYFNFKIVFEIMFIIVCESSTCKYPSTENNSSVLNYYVTLYIILYYLYIYGEIIDYNYHELPTNKHGFIIVVF